MIENKLTTKVRLALEQYVYNGDGISPNLEGIVTVAPVFAAGTFAASVDNANEVDVLAVAQNQIELANCLSVSCDVALPCLLSFLVIKGKHGLCLLWPLLSHNN